jgi:hypothetical protein
VKYSVLIKINANLVDRIHEFYLYCAYEFQQNLGFAHSNCVAQPPTSKCIPRVWQSAAAADPLSIRLPPLREVVHC